MKDFPEDERTPEQIAKKAQAYNEWILKGDLNAVQMRSIRLFLKRHGATLANPEFTGDQP